MKRTMGAQLNCKSRYPGNPSHIYSYHIKAEIIHVNPLSNTLQDSPCLGLSLRLLVPVRELAVSVTEELSAAVVSSLACPLSELSWPSLIITSSPATSKSTAALLLTGAPSSPTVSYTTAQAGFMLGPKEHITMLLWDIKEQRGIKTKTVHVT